MATAIFQQRRRIGFLWAISPVIVFIALFSRSAWPEGSLSADVLRFAGLLLVLACIAGRCWAALYVGGRKNRSLVTDGPYASTRNPLYLFSSFGLAGLGLLFGSLILGLLLFGLAYAVFRYVIIREETALAAMFGQAYRDYCLVTPRFFWNFSRRAQQPGTGNTPVEFNPVALRRTAIDTSYFLMAVPAVYIIQRLQSAQIIEPLFALY